jgi:hypothetical protein
VIELLDMQAVQVGLYIAGIVLSAGYCAYRAGRGPWAVSNDEDGGAILLAMTLGCMAGPICWAIYAVVAFAMHCYHRGRRDAMPRAKVVRDA